MYLLNICYKYLNRIIDSEQLLKELNDSLEEEKDDKNLETLKDLIKQIEKIIAEVPVEEDEYIKTQKLQQEKMLKSLEEIKASSIDTEILNLVESLEKHQHKKFDSQEKWLKIVKCIEDFKYIDEIIKNMTNNELLDFITQYIFVPNPIELTQEEFNTLVKIGIENDSREKLWRLAYNYYIQDINISEIIKYFINEKDDYYFSELISAVGEKLNIDEIFDSINDKEFIKKIVARKDAMKGNVTENQIQKLINKLN